MSVIGIYDSGIGGLTTLCKLKKEIKNCDFFYYSDNMYMPLGTKNADFVRERAAHASKMLKDNADVSVFACNTASMNSTDKEVFKLQPDLSHIEPSETLVMATPLTMQLCKANDLMFNTSSTASLAMLVEIQASLSFKRKILNFNELSGYLRGKIGHFFGVKNVVLGCSHYIYLKDQINLNLGAKINYFDGNDKVVEDVKKFAVNCQGDGKIEFAFSGANESEKYRWLLSQLEKTYI